MWTKRGKVQYVAAVFAIAGLIAGLWLLLLPESLAKRAGRLPLGATKADVEKLLGRPNFVFQPNPAARTNVIAAMLSVPVETWVYGSRFDLKKVWHGELPIRLRLFGPDSEDLSLEFGSHDRLSAVHLPRQTGK